MLRHLLIHPRVFVVLAVIGAASTPVMADWDVNNPADVARAKWIQLPDLNPTGLDVLATQQPSTTAPGQWKILADDFLCVQSGPITDIHLWGSWLENILPTDPSGAPDPGALTFKLSFHSDVPVSIDNPFSHPGEELWTGIFQPGSFRVNPNVITAQEQFYDPNLDQIIGQDNLVFQYNFENFDEPFVQDEGTIYWLDVQTLIPQQPGQLPAVFGWKTSRLDQRFNDDAVFADTDGFAGPLLTPWTDMHYPEGHEFAGLSMDMSFVLTVPEPSSIVLAGASLAVFLGIAVRRRRRLAA
jgi:hypothetical protein